jgi:hypothetical protein
MNDLNSPFETPTKPSSGLNIVSILTIIGSIISIAQSILTFFSIDKSYADMKQMMESDGLKDSPAFVKNFMNKDMLLQLEKALEFKIPIMILAVVGSVLCLIGAIEMRKLKAHGYTFWLCGELLPILSTIIFIGVNAFAGFSLLSLIFPGLFIVLYSVYRKELVNQKFQREKS